MVTKRTSGYLKN